jgi:hypothetical protein
MKLYDSGIYFVFLIKSAPFAPAGWREFLCSFYVFIYLILTWKQSVIYWCVCVGRVECTRGDVMKWWLAWNFTIFGLNCHKSWQLCVYPWTHTCTGYINLHNNWTEKSCFLSQSTVVYCMTGTLIKKARSKINILYATGHWSGTIYGT